MAVESVGVLMVTVRQCGISLMNRIIMQFTPTAFLSRKRSTARLVVSTPTGCNLKTFLVIFEPVVFCQGVEFLFKRESRLLRRSRSDVLGYLRNICNECGIVLC